MSQIDFANIGYDFGIKPVYMLVGDNEFSELFKKASCQGVLYIFAKGEDETLFPVQMAFLFENEEPAEKFLTILIGWVEKSNNDGDAVTIDFIENNKGGYTLVIAPEVHRFIERMIPRMLKDYVTPMTMLTTQFKKLDSIGKNYLNFKANYKKAEKIAVGYAIGTPSKIIKQSKKYFTKKEFNFYKENEIPQGSMGFGYGATKDFVDLKKENLPKLPKESLEDISVRRISEMKKLLPLTYNKVQNLWIAEVQKKLIEEYDKEIIKQAICNLTVFERLKQRKEISTAFTKPGYPHRILEYLLSTYESFDSFYPPDDFYTEERVLRQIKNDKWELENYLNK